MVDSSPFPTDIWEVGAALQLPMAVTQQMTETGMVKLHEWQAECLGTFLEAEKSSRGTETRNLVYSAPTSGGKTMVASLLMLRRVALTGGRALYVLPLRATVKEKYHELTSLLKLHNLNSMVPSDGTTNDSFTQSSDSEPTLIVGKIPVKNLVGEADKSMKAGKGRILICTFEKANILLNDILLEAQAGTAPVAGFAEDNQAEAKSFRANGGDGRFGGCGAAAESANKSATTLPLVSVVIDEAHMLEDKVPMELLLTKLRYLQRHQERPPWVPPPLPPPPPSFHARAPKSLAAPSLQPELRSPPRPCLHCQVVAFSATLPNAEALGTWLNNAVVFQALKRPTPLSFTIAIPNPVGVITPTDAAQLLEYNSQQKQQQKQQQQQQQAKGKGRLAPRQQPLGQQKQQQSASATAPQPGSSSSSSSSTSASCSSASALGTLQLDSIKESADQERRRFVDTVLRQASSSGSSSSSSEPSSSSSSSSSGEVRGAVLVFCGTKKDCEVTAEALAKERAARATAKEVRHQDLLKSGAEVGGAQRSVEDPQRRWVRKAMERLDLGGASHGGGFALVGGGESGLKESLQRLFAQGVCYFHALLPQAVKDLVLEAYQRKALDVLVSTSSLAVGVNLPVRCVVLRGVFKWGASTPWEASEFRQMAGRAGRTGQCSEGSCIIHCRDAKPSTLSLALKLLQDSPKPVKSPLSLSWRRCCAAKSSILAQPQPSASISATSSVASSSLVSVETKWKTNEENKQRLPVFDSSSSPLRAVVPGDDDGSGGWPMELMSDEEIEDSAEVQSLVPSLRAVILEGVASALVQDTRQLAQFARSTFLWQELQLPTAMITTRVPNHFAASDGKLDADRRDESEPKQQKNSSEILNRQRKLSCALSCALRNLLHARIIAVSDDGRYGGQRQACPGCFDRGIGGETLRLAANEPEATAERNLGQPSFADGRQRSEEEGGGYLVCPRCDYQGVRPLRVTPLGRAIFVAGLSPDEGILLNQELSRASQGLMVGTSSHHLHAIYLLTSCFNQNALYPVQQVQSESTGKLHLGGNSLQQSAPQELVAWHKLLDLLPSSEEEATRAIAAEEGMSDNEVDGEDELDSNEAGAPSLAAIQGGLSETAQERARRLAWEDKTSRRETDAFATKFFDIAQSSSAAVTAGTDSEGTDGSRVSLGFDFARHLLSSLPQPRSGSGGLKQQISLPPDAAAVLAAPAYEVAGRTSKKISPKERRERQRVAVIATAAKLWGAMAIREVGPRDLDPQRAAQTFGTGFRSFRDANLIHMHQVLRFVRELHAGAAQSEAAGVGAPASSSGGKSNDDPLYAYLKHVVKLLHKKVDRKFAPLFRFLSNGLRTRLALSLSKSLYRKHVRSVAHLAALAGASPESPSKASSSSSCSSSSFSDHVPVEVLSALVESGYLDDAETKRQVKAHACSPAFAGGIKHGTGKRDESSTVMAAASHSLLQSVGQGLLRAAHKAVYTRSSKRNRYKKTQSPQIRCHAVSSGSRGQESGRKATNQNAGAAPGTKGVADAVVAPMSKRLSLMSTDSDLLSPIHRRGNGEANSENSEDGDSLDSSDSSDSSSSGSDSDDSSTEIDLDAGSDEEDDGGEGEESVGGRSVVGRCRSLSLMTGADDWGDDDDDNEALQGLNDNDLIEEPVACPPLSSPPLTARTRKSMPGSLGGVKLTAMSATATQSHHLCTQLEVSQKASFAIEKMMQKVPSHMIRRLRLPSPAAALLRSPPSFTLHSPFTTTAGTTTSSHVLAPPSLPALSWQSVLESGWYGAVSFAVVLRVCPRDVSFRKPSTSFGWGKGKGKGKGGSSKGAGSDSNSNSFKSEIKKRVPRVVAWKNIGLGKGLLSSYPSDLLPADRGCAPSADRPYVVGGVGIVLGSGHGPSSSFFLPLPLVPPKINELPPKTNENTGFGDEATRVNSQPLSTAKSFSSSSSSFSAPKHEPRHLVFSMPSLLAHIASFQVVLPCHLPALQGASPTIVPWYLIPEGATRHQNQQRKSRNSSDPDVNFLLVNSVWHGAGRTSMSAFLSRSPKSPWTLARRLLECEDSENFLPNCGDHVRNDSDAPELKKSRYDSSSSSSSSSSPTTVSSSECPSPTSSSFSYRFYRVAHQLQVQAAALRACANHRNCSFDSSRTSRGRNNNGSGCGNALGVVVRGWLADPVVAAAMIEAAAPDAVSTLLKSTSTCAPIRGKGGGKGGGGGGAEGRGGGSSVSMQYRSAHGKGKGCGKGSNSGHEEKGGHRGENNGSPAWRAVASARAALRFMSQMESLLETYQLVEPFVLVEMPLVPCMVELSVGGMALDWRALRRLKDDVEEQKRALQRLAETVLPVQSANFGGVIVSRSVVEMNLSSPKDVKEMVEYWNLPTLLRRYGGSGGSSGATAGGALARMGKSDTKTETLQAYLDAIGQVSIRQRQYQQSKQDKGSGGGNTTDDFEFHDAQRFLECALEYRRLDKLPASLIGLQAYAVRMHCLTPPPPPRFDTTVETSISSFRDSIPDSALSPMPSKSSLPSSSLSSSSESKKRRSTRQMQKREQIQASQEGTETQRKRKLKAASSGIVASSSHCASVKDCATAPPKKDTFSTVILDRVLPDVIHATASNGNSGALMLLTGSGGVNTNNTGLASTGRVSVRPLQHVQKEVCFRRPCYRSLSEDLRFHSIASKALIGSRCMLTFAGDGAATVTEVATGSSHFEKDTLCDGGGGGDGGAGAGSRAHINGPTQQSKMRFSRGGSVRFGVLRSIGPKCIADTLAFTSASLPGDQNVSSSSSSSSSSSFSSASVGADAQVIGVGGGTTGGSLSRATCASDGSGASSVAEYWRSRGFEYSTAQALKVLAVEVELAPGSFVCSYPADQVFRIDHGSVIRFPDEESDDEADDDDGTGDEGGADVDDTCERTSHCGQTKDQDPSAAESFEHLGSTDDSPRQEASSKSKKRKEKEKEKKKRERPWSCEVSASPRDVLIASQGRVFVSADYAQIEVRLLAHYSEDPNLIAAFTSNSTQTSSSSSKVKENRNHADAEPLKEKNEGMAAKTMDCVEDGTEGVLDGGEDQDFFRRIARQWKQLPPSAPVSATDRAAAKELCYGIVYGMGEGRLAAAMKVTISEARKCLRDFSTQFHEATEFKERVQRDCSRQDMTVKTLLGRQRCVTKVYTQALNTVVQGSAADLIKVAMVRIQDRLKRELIEKGVRRRQGGCSSWLELERRCRLVNMLHDEVMYEVAVEDVETVARIVKDEMENSLPCLKVPLKVELKVGPRWGTMETYQPLS